MPSFDAGVCESHVGLGRFDGGFLTRLDPHPECPHHLLGQAEQLVVEDEALLGRHHGHERPRRLGDDIGAQGLVIPQVQLFCFFGRGDPFRPFAAQFDDLGDAQRDLGFREPRVRPRFALRLPAECGQAAGTEPSRKRPGPRTL